MDPRQKTEELMVQSSICFSICSKSWFVPAGTGSQHLNSYDRDSRWHTCKSTIISCHFLHSTFNNTELWPLSEQQCNHTNKFLAEPLCPSPACARNRVEFFSSSSSFSLHWNYIRFRRSLGFMEGETWDTNSATSLLYRTKTGIYGVPADHW